MENPVWKTIGKISDMAVLSIAFILCCLPVVTIIPACCALFDSVSRCVLQDQPGYFTRFFRTFKSELKTSILLTIFWFLLGIIFLCGNQILVQLAQQDKGFRTYCTLYQLIFLLLAAWVSWIVPLQARYHLTFVQLHRNALFLCLARLPSTIAMLAIPVLTLVLCLTNPYTLILLIIAPALITFMQAFLVEKAFKTVFSDEDSQN